MGHRTDLTVAWGDTDAGGLIYYPRFFHYATVALNDYFAPAFDGDHPMESLRQDGLVLPAVDASASFESPLSAGDDVVVASAVTTLGESSLAFAFRVDGASGSTRASGGGPVASGTVTFVLVDEDWAATPLPDSMRECVGDRGDPSAPPAGT